MAKDARKPIIDDIMTIALVTGETVGQELRERLVAEMEDRYPLASLEEMVEIARKLLEDFEPVLAETLSDAEIAAAIAGWDEVVQKLPAEVLQEFGDQIFLPPAEPPFERRGIIREPEAEAMIRLPIIEEAAENLIARNVVTRSQFDIMTDAMKQQSFTVANQATTETIDEIRKALVDTIAAGASLEEFRERVGQTIAAGAIGSAHLENVYRTNIQSAFHAAHDEMANDPIVFEVFPYQAYIAIHDGRVREDHLALESLGLDGTNIYRLDDPFWQRFLPPWDFQCRCGVNLMTIEAAAKRGVKEAQRWLRTGVPPDFPEHRNASIPFDPPRGFVGPRRRRLVV